MNLDSFIKEIISPLFQSLDMIEDAVVVDRICRDFSGFIPSCSDENLALLLAQPINGTVSRQLFEQIIDGMDEAQFKKVLAALKTLYDQTVFRHPANALEVKALENAWQNLLNSHHGSRLSKSKKEVLETLKTNLSDLLKGDKKAFNDRELMQALPEGVEQLIVKGKLSTAEAIVERLADGLGSGELNIRISVCETLAEIADFLIASDQLDIMIRLSYKLIEWFNLEHELTPVHPKICLRLQRLAQTLIRKNRFTECRHILESFNLIYCGEIRKPESIQALAEKAIKEIASEDILERLIKEFQTDEENKRKQAIENLILMGLPSAERLLNLLRESQSRYERTRILQVISDIGKIAVPAIVDQIRHREPWYFIRNLVLLIGKVGDESHLPVLKPLLHYGDLRVQREVINSIYHIAEKESEDIFFAILPLADDRLKLDIVSLLGEMESRSAVPILLTLLKACVNSASPIKQELAERICMTLGIIGSGQAMPALIEIIGQFSSVTGKKSYQERIKAAAIKSLAKIRSHLSETDSSPDSEKKIISHQEKFIGRYLARWNNDDTVEEYAVKLLMDLIVKYAREKDFSRAEFYRDKLIQLDPTAQAEVRAADEIINLEKQDVGEQVLIKRPKDIPEVTIKRAESPPEPQIKTVLSEPKTPPKAAPEVKTVLSERKEEPPPKKKPEFEKDAFLITRW